MKSLRSVVTPRLRSSLMRLDVILAAPLFLLSLFVASALTLSAATQRDLTVCPAGPPLCDYALIQAALDAAVAGDRVIVAPGVYVGQLTLKSGVALESASGPETTIIQATSGPIISGSRVVSATVRGVSITGLALLDGAVGIELNDSEVSIVDSIVGDLLGEEGQTNGADGETAVAIRSAGAGNLTLEGVTIQNVTGGNGRGSATGGAAIGIVATGDGSVTVAGTTIRQLRGGNPRNYPASAYVCEGGGGDAIGIDTNGNVALMVSASQITGLTGGDPCRALAAYCEREAGVFVGITANGGSVLVRDSVFSGFFGPPAWNSPFASSVRTVSTELTRLEHNTINSLSRISGAGAAATGSVAPDSPYCSPPPGTVLAVFSEGDSQFSASDNGISDIAGTGQAASVTGIFARSAGVVSLVGNRIVDLLGGSGGIAASGILLESVVSANVDANFVSEIHGEDAPDQFYYAYTGAAGGTALGISMNTVGLATLTNNVVAKVSGGAGSDIPGAGWGQSGGSAIATAVGNSAARLWNNTLYQTTAGQNGPGINPAPPGRAVGLSVASEKDVSAANNAIVGH